MFCVEDQTSKLTYSTLVSQYKAGSQIFMNACVKSAGIISLAEMTCICFFTKTDAGSARRENEPRGGVTG